MVNVGESVEGTANVTFIPNKLGRNSCSVSQVWKSVLGFISRMFGTSKQCLVKMVTHFRLTLLHNFAAVNIMELVLNNRVDSSLP
ncbi:hypothetical protein HNY73_004412 [Argiope bruennichi]|uniref:Uncharacterized protein n=1 Tax=Argiope bruennichi TaxID=94029 RepID=A0A8T0FRE2_ARGBR|nr:hypothetical protein HNY73_004412 [Argiope bruennichi]